MHTRRSLAVAVVALVVTGGCDSSDPELPEIATPLGYDTVRVELSGCNVPLPPVRDSSRCGAAEIGKSIDLKDVCQLLVALKGWVDSGPADALSVHADDWPHVRAVCVSRLGPNVTVSSKEWPRVVLTQERPAVRSVVRLEADIPNRSLIIYVQMSEDSRRLKYFAGRRNLPATFIISDSGW
jgi:hypothetical protein